MTPTKFAVEPSLDTFPLGKRVICSHCFEGQYADEGDLRSGNASCRTCGTLLTIKDTLTEYRKYLRTLGAKKRDLRTGRNHERV